MMDLEASEAKLTELNWSLLDQVKREKASNSVLKILVDQQKVIDPNRKEDLLDDILEKELEEFLNLYLNRQ